MTNPIPTPSDDGGEIERLRDVLASRDGTIRHLKRLVADGLAALNTGRSEPLFIWRNQVRVFLDDVALTADGARERALEEAATCDSDGYRHTFYGILNAQRQFWTPLAFDNEQSAKEHVRRFWAGQPGEADRFLSKCRIVPVRVRLTALAHRGDEAREREEA